MPDGFLDGVGDRRLTRPDGRVVAWTEWGGGGVPLLRIPGTPGCRYNLRADRSPWSERDLHVITTERPGFGASTPLPGRGFHEHSDDLAAILDEMGIDAVHVIGGSGSAPHQLAFAARHPDRVRAMSILVGAAPVTEAEAETMVEINRVEHRMMVDGDWDGVRRLVDEAREQVLAEPLAGFLHILREAPEADQVVMSDPRWQDGLVESVVEALQQGAQGWYDESVAIFSRWDEIDLSAVRCSVTWYHGEADANCPYSAALRVVEALPDARLVPFRPEEGHLAGYHREPEILDELLAR
ncbi:MAG TPA: alpha/beta hydrolase [Candidatus Nanopelagicales bacterium]|nr:alpha/beta hydrolase [Candidatus Nanopelagicales bacterium]